MMKSANYSHAHRERGERREVYKFRCHIDPLTEPTTNLAAAAVPLPGSTEAAAKRV
jgi:hypothetical protein